MNELKEISKSAVTKAVLGKSAQQATTVYPAVVATLGGMSALAFGLNVFTLGALAVGATLGASGFFGNYFFNKDKYAGDYMSSVRARLIKKREALLDGLEEELSAANEYRGVSQIKLFAEKYDNLLSILGKKLNQNELTYMRYLTIAEQVFLGGIDNLESVSLALKSISAIDVENIGWQIDQAKQNGDQALVDTLNKRLTLHEQQLSRATNLLAQNDAALTELDHVTTKLANTKTEQGHAVMDIDDAMSELGSLIKRADKYSIKQAD